MRFGIDTAYRFDLVAEKFDTYGIILGWRPHVENIAAKGESAVIGKLRLAPVPCLDKRFGDSGRVDRVAAFYGNGKTSERLGIGKRTLQSVDGSYDELCLSSRNHTECFKPVRGRASAAYVAINERIGGSGQQNRTLREKFKRIVQPARKIKIARNHKRYPLAGKRNRSRAGKFGHAENRDFFSVPVCAGKPPDFGIFEN